MELKFSYNYAQINDSLGPDGRPANSFLTPGNNVTTDLTYFQDHSWNSGRVQVLGIVRNTNDIRVDPEQNSFQRGYFRFYSKTTEVNFGDYLVNYSRFTYNQNVKGVSLVKKFSDNLKLSGNIGLFADRWGSTFKDDILGKPFSRFVAGFRAEEKLSRNKVIGFNFSEGHDLVGSIRPDLQVGLIPINNQIVSVDTKMDFGRKFSIDGEAAYSLTNPNTELQHIEVGDWAARLDTRYRSGPLSIRTNYTRMEPNFLAVNARQLADLQDAGVNVGVDLGSHVTAEGSYRYTENDLKHDRPEGATIFKVPEVRFSFRRIPHAGRLLFDFGYRERRQTGPEITAPGVLNTDKAVRIPYADLSLPIGTTLATVGYEHRANTDHHDATQSTGVNRLSFSLRTIIDLGGWQISPLFRFETEREEFFTAFGVNNNRNIQGIVYVEAPKYWLGEFIYRQVGATLFTQCLVAVGTQCGGYTTLPVNTSVLLPSGFGRPQYRTALTYKFRNNTSREMIFSADRNSNFFAIPGRNFDERVFAVTLLWRYKK